MICYVVDINQEELYKFERCMKAVCPDITIFLRRNPDVVLQEIMEIRPDIFITEVELGNQDGISLAKCVKEKSPESSIYVMNNSLEYAIAAWQIHPKGYLLKPITEDRLREDLLWQDD